MHRRMPISRFTTQTWAQKFSRRKRRRMMAGMCIGPLECNVGKQQRAIVRVGQRASEDIIACW